MDYLKLLPINIHEEIAQRINIEEPYYDVEITNSNHYDYQNYIFVILKKKQYVPKNIKDIFSKNNNDPTFPSLKPKTEKNYIIKLKKIFYDLSKNVFIGINNFDCISMIFPKDYKLYILNDGCF